MSTIVNNLLVQKLRTQLNSSNQAEYFWPGLPAEFCLNDAIGKKISLKFTGKIQCLECGKSIRKSFQNGYCYPCTLKLAETDLCQVRPETCHYSLGTCRDSQYAAKYCFIPHTVYLAQTPTLKVGITRTPINRWIDQGAMLATPLGTCSDRLSAGKVEVLLKEHFKDKTNWRDLLVGKQITVEDSLELAWQKALNALPPEVLTFFKPQSSFNAQTITYPVNTYLTKAQTINLEKTPEISSLIQGIRGQYLILEQGALNIRSHSGYLIDLEISL